MKLLIVFAAISTQIFAPQAEDNCFCRAARNMSQVLDKFVNEVKRVTPLPGVMHVYDSARRMRHNFKIDMKAICRSSNLKRINNLFVTYTEIVHILSLMRFGQYMRFERMQKLMSKHVFYNFFGGGLTLEFCVLRMDYLPERKMNPVGAFYG